MFKKEKDISFWKHLKRFFRERDIFGHEIKLNFNQKGDTHNTYVGGIFSILVKIVYFLYMGYLIK